MPACCGPGCLRCEFAGFYRNLPEMEVVAGMGIVPAQLDVMHNKWSVQDVYTDWRVRTT